QQYVIEEAEDGRVGTNSESQRENRDNSECRTFIQRLEPVTHVLKQIFDPKEATRIAATVFYRRYAAGGSESSSSCLAGRHTRGSVLVCPFIDKEREFGFEILFQSLASKDRA